MIFAVTTPPRQTATHYRVRFATSDRGLSPFLPKRWLARLMQPLVLMRRAVSCVLMISWTLIASAAGAQALRYPFDEKLRPEALKPSDVAVQAASPSGFLPAAWKTMLQIEQDVTGDGVADIAWTACPTLVAAQIEHEEREASCGACVPTTFSCALLVARREGQLFRIIEVVQHLPTSRAIRTDLRIEAGKLHVTRQRYGHYSSRRVLSKFRFDSKRRRMRLIGREIELHAFDEPSEYRSENWLTRRALERQCDYQGCSAWKPSNASFPRHRWYLSDGLSPSRRLVRSR